MVRTPCCEKTVLKKGPWTPEEDQILINHIRRNGHENWRKLPREAGLLRCGKSCRLRWINYLRPDIKRGNFTPEEEDAIIRLHQLLGNRWSAIAAKLPGRTDNEIKNVWHTHLKKRLIKQQQDNNNSASSSSIEAIRVESKSCNEEVPVSSQSTASKSSISVSSQITTSDDNNNSANVADYEEDNSFDGTNKNDDIWSEVLSENNHFIGVEGFSGLQFQPILSPPLLPVSGEMDNSWLMHDSDDVMDYCYDLSAKAADDICCPSDFGSHRSCFLF